MSQRQEPTEDTFLSLLETEEFQFLLCESSRRPLIRREMNEMPLPHGFSQETTWKTLTSIRRNTAFYSPNVECNNQGVHKNWHTVPASLQHTLFQLSTLSQQGSTLDKIIEERRGSRFITQQYIEEVLTNLAYDGFDPDYESIRAAILGDRASETVPEKIAVNYHRIMQDLESYKHRSFDRSLLNDFYAQLIDGITGEELSSVSSQLILPRIETASSRDVALEAVLAIGNDLLTEPTQNPIMVSMLINCKFWRHNLFEHCNNLLSGIASRFYLLQKGYPVFRYIPKSKILYEWKKLGTTLPGARYSYEESQSLEGFDTDWTAYYDTMMKLMLLALEKMQKTLSGLKSSDDLLISGIDELHDLNYRQQMILQQSVLTPEIEFRISTHGKRYGIVYSTARADLEYLADTGFFLRMTIGPANVYKAVPHLQFFLKSLLDNGGTRTI